MNYQRIYNELVERAISRVSVNGYSEKHHIVPRSHNGPDTDDNLVVLTAREHFIAHWLLWRIHRDPPMAHAFNLMRVNPNENAERYFNSYAFAEAKIAASWAKSIRPVSEETRQKLSEAGKGRIISDEQKAKISKANKGRKRSPEFCQLISDLKKGRPAPPRSAEARAKTSAALRGKKKSAEHCANVSAALKGQKRGPHSDEHKANLSNAHKNKPPVVCPHCNKSGAESQMKRWHFDNCPAVTGKKHKSNVAGWNKGQTGGKLSDEHKAKLKAVATAPEKLAKFRATLAAKPVIVCPHCSKESKGAANMKRYHFDNCKQKAA